ncbi:MAG: hypothetical protein HWN67_20880 [Candidatus Helarchaeota archaeon]|nr:hypothetical protein [Candidatus Helarchaeota archaeon]
MRIEALIQDSDNINVTSGNCSIYLYNYSNDLVFSENITVVNDTVISNNISTTNYTAGDYNIIVTWTNGSEVGFNSFIISIQNQTIPFIPPEEKPIGAYVAATAMILGPQEPILLYIITTVLVVITAMVGGLIARRKMQERNWEKSLLHLFIMNKDGRAMYDYSFGIEQKDPTLISGMLTALTSFVKETIGSKKQLKTIDQEDKKIILGHGTYSTVAIFAEKDLPIMHHKTSDFLKTFEDSYSGKIKQWDGSTAVFKRVNKIVEKYFPTSAEDQIIRSIGRELLGFKESIISTTDPKEIFGLLQLATKLTEKYQEIIREHYNKEYGEILKIVNEKIKSSE